MLKLEIDKSQWVKWAPTSRQLGKIARLVKMVEVRNKRIRELEAALRAAIDRLDKRTTANRIADAAKAALGNDRQMLGGNTRRNRGEVGGG